LAISPRTDWLFYFFLERIVTPSANGKICYLEQAPTSAAYKAHLLSKGRGDRHRGGPWRAWSVVGINRCKRLRRVLRGSRYSYSLGILQHAPLPCPVPSLADLLQHGGEGFPSPRNGAYH